MKLHRLKKTSDYKVKEWLEKELQLTPYQKSKLYQEEIIRLAPFYFYEKRQKEKVSIIWRFTIILFLIYLLILTVGLPFTFFINGKWGYGDKLFDFHSKWTNKLNL